MVGSIAAAATAIGTAYLFFGGPIPASRDWTLAQVERLERNQKDQGTILLDIRRSQLERNIIDLENRGKTMRRTSDEEFRLRGLREDLRRLDVQIDQMRK